MLDRKKINELFSELNDELGRRGVMGEVGICGGAVMCLVFNARESTKDVDAIFQPTREIREAAIAVASRHRVPEDWLNDAARGYFLSTPPVVEVINLDHLRVWAPAPPYMLAMKCVSARFDSHDADDVKYLIDFLELETAEQVFSIIQEYYPRKVIPPKTQFFIEEIFDVPSC
jgi:hypothetical protein